MLCMHARPHLRKDYARHHRRLAITVPARSSLLFDLAYHDGNIIGSKGPRGTTGNGDISEARCILFKGCLLYDVYKTKSPDNYVATFVYV